MSPVRYRPLRRWCPAAAAFLVVAAGSGVVLGAPSAQAAACSGSTGVSVVVDFSGHGGGIETACDEGGAGKSAAAMVNAGFGLTYVQRQPGFVCRVRGIPAADPCVNTPPADAYWGLFYADPGSGRWIYSSVGIGGLKVSDGGSIGLAWQDGGVLEVPSVAPAVIASPPAPTPKPSTPKSSKPSSKPTKSSAKPTVGPTRTPAVGPTGAPAATSSPIPGESGESERVEPGDGEVSPSPAKAVNPSKSRSTEAEPAGPAEPSASATEAEESPEAVTATEPEVANPAAADDAGGRLPTWLSLVLLAGLPVIALAVWWRRRGTETP